MYALADVGFLPIDAGRGHHRSDALFHETRDDISLEVARIYGFRGLPVATRGSPSRE